MSHHILSFAEYKAIVEQSPILIWRSNIQAECDYFNERWLVFTGRTMEQELGNGWTEGVHPEDLERCLKNYRDAFASQCAFEMVYRLRRHDGKYRWLLDRGGPLFDGESAFTGYIGSCVDVTEKVEADQVAQKAQIAEMDTLRGLLPICAACKKIRDDKGYWNEVEVYVKERSAAIFSHSICPDCTKKLYPEYSDVLHPGTKYGSYSK